MGAGEHQGQAAVRDLARDVGAGRQFLGHEGQVSLAGPSGLAPAQGVALTSAGHGEQPGVRIVRGA